jgi:hypothetical protein
MHIKPYIRSLYIYLENVPQGAECYSPLTVHKEKGLQSWSETSVVTGLYEFKPGQDKNHCYIFILSGMDHNLFDRW